MIASGSEEQIFRTDRRTAGPLWTIAPVTDPEILDPGKPAERWIDLVVDDSLGTTGGADERVVGEMRDVKRPSHGNIASHQSRAGSSVDGDDHLGTGDGGEVAIVAVVRKFHLLVRADQRVAEQVVVGLRADKLGIASGSEANALGGDIPVKRAALENERFRLLCGPTYGER